MKSLLILCCFLPCVHYQPTWERICRPEALVVEEQPVEEERPAIHLYGVIPTQDEEEKSSR